MYDNQLGNNIRIKNANTPMTIYIKKRLYQLGTKKPTNLHGPWLFLEFNVFISPLLSSTLEETHSPKKVLLDERGLKKKTSDGLAS